jgi:hypothetical protein
MEIQQDDGIYRTLDLALAAYCKTIGYEILDIETKKVKGQSFKRSTICIETDEALKEKIREYFDNKAMVDPQTFYNNVRSLKARIVNECRG